VCTGDEERRTMKAIPTAVNWHPDLSIYASEGFLRTAGDEYGWIGGMDDTGNLACVLPYVLIRKAVFRLVRFPVQTILLRGDLAVDREQTFLKGVVSHFQDRGADLIMPSTFNAVFRTYPSGAAVAPYGNYLLDLKQEENDLWRGLHQKHRNVIRSATKSGVRVRSGWEDLEAAHELVLSSFLRSAKGRLGRARVRVRMNYESFRRQIEGFGEHVGVFVAERDGVAQSCAVVPYSARAAYYMHGGSIASPITGASNLLQWEIMRFLRARGVAEYDFFGTRLEPEKGSKAAGIARFKERFGGRLVRGYMWKQPLRRVKAWMYAMAADVRSGGDVVDQEGRRLRGSGGRSTATLRGIGLSLGVNDAE
jgi:Acetyltransferase (GNAT) domain